MERCPPELHAVMLDLACTDNGRTARSLQRVNHYFRSLSHPYAFRSLQISGLRQLKGAILSLDRAQCSSVSGTIPQPIEHLFLSDRAQEHASSEGLTLTRTARYEEERERLFRTLDDEAEHFARILPLLLTRAAPTLRTLTFLAFAPYHAAHTFQLVLTRRYPNLTDITLRGSAWEVHPPDEFTTTSSTRGGTVSSRRPLPGLFPNLERVHLAATRVFTRILRQITHSSLPASSSAPQLSRITHVRLSGLSKDVRLAARLHTELHAVGLAPRSIPNLTRRLARHPEISCADAPDWSPILPSSVNGLAKVLLQPHKLPPLTDCACCSGYFLTEEMGHVLCEIAKFEPKEEEGRYAYVPASKEGDVYAYAHALKDWTERIEGGGGCWAVPVEEDEEQEAMHKWEEEDFAHF